MGTYVSPFGNKAAAPTGTSSPTNAPPNSYISPFKGSQYTADYWQKQAANSAAQQQQDAKKKQIQDNLNKSQSDVQKAKDAVLNPGNILGDIGNAVKNFTTGANEKILGGVTKAVVKGVNTVASGFNQNEANKRTDAFLKNTGQVNNQGQAPAASGPNVNRNSGSFKAGSITGSPADLVADAYKSGRNFVQQAIIGGKVAQGSGIDQKAADKLKAFVDQDQKAGKLSKQAADAKRNNIQAEVTKTNAAIAAGEKQTGVKFNQASGVTDLLNTAANATGLDGVAKSLFEKAASLASQRLGRDLSQKEVENLAVQTKNTLPTKPAEPVVTPEPVAPTNENPIRPTEPIATIPNHQAPEPINSLPVGATGEAPTLPTPAVPEGALSPQAAMTPTPELVKPIGEKLPTPPEAPITEPTPVATPTASIEKPVVEPPKEPPVGDTISGNSKRIEQAALEKKLTNTMGDLPQYKSINMKEQSEKALDLVRNDRQKAIDIINGKANAPDGLHPQSIHQALEVIATKEGNGELLTQLAKSHINTELSESAQKLRIAAEREPNSPVEAIRQVRETRIKAAERRSGTTVEKEAANASAAVKKSTRIATKQDLASFIKELTC